MPRKSADVIRSFTKMLPVDLSNEQLQERGTKLAHAQEKLEQHNLDAKAQRAELREAKKGLELAVHSLAETVRLKKEEREVERVLRHAKRAGFVEEVRLDTKEVISTRPSSDDDSQGDLLNGAGDEDSDGPELVA